MIKLLGFITTVLICSVLAFSQPQLTTRWARSIPNALTSTQAGMGGSIQIDSVYNVIVAGTTPVVGDYEDIVLTKYNPDGVTLWRNLFSYVGLMRVGGRSADFLNDMVLDGAGNAYFTAYSQLVDANQVALLTVKVNKLGVAVWAQAVTIANGSQTLNGSYIRLDHQGNVTVAATIYDNVGSITEDVLLVHYANDGTPLWLKKFNYTAGNDEFVKGLAVADSSGGIYIVGKTTVGGSSLSFIAKYNKSGDSLWAYTFGTGDSWGSATGIAIDHSENLYVSAFDHVGDKAIAYSCNSSGALRYQQIYDVSGGFDMFNAVAVDKAGNAYYTGMTQIGGTPGYEMLCVKYDPTGTKLWASTYSGPYTDHENEQAHAVVVDGQGNPYIAGLGYSGNAAGYDFASVKFDPSTGTKLWTARYNGPPSQAEQMQGAQPLAVDSIGGVYITGRSAWIVTPVFSENMVTVKFTDPTFVLQAPVAAPGDVNLEAPPVAAPKTHHTNGADGYGRLAQLHFTVVGSAGNVHLSFYDSGVSDSLFDGPIPQSLSDYSWTFSDSGIAPYSVEVRFDYTQILNSGINDSSIVTIYHRPVPGNGNFSPLTTTKVGTEFRATVTTLGEFILGIADTTAGGGGGSGPDTTIVFNLAANWNMVSVPALHAVLLKDTLFPGSSSSAFAYAAGYQTADTLKPGQGYWLKFPSAAPASIEGAEILRDTIPVQTGWNLIGALSIPCAVSSIASDPPGLVISSAFGYSNGYAIADSLMPGRGYWIHSASNGNLYLSQIGASPRTSVRIVRTDALPPAPPENGTASLKNLLPGQFAIHQNYPNPFNPTTIITYDLPSSADVDLKIYNIFGQEVTSLVHGTQSAGFKTATWNASGMASGVYLCRLQAGKYSRSIKLQLVR